MTRAELEAYCVGKTFTLSPVADKVIKKVNEKEGHCPCRLDVVKCPCPTHLDEISRHGYCLCRLFVALDAGIMKS